MVDDGRSVSTTCDVLAIIRTLSQPKEGGKDMQLALHQRLAFKPAL